MPVIACVDEASETAQMINENNCGWVSAPDSPVELVQKIINLKKEHEKRVTWKENAERAVNQKFHINLIVENMQKFCGIMCDLIP